MQPLNGKIALVTGGGRGIGRALALALAQAGCDVAVVARTATEIEQVATEARQLGRRSLAQVCDISSSAAVVSAYATIVQALGEIDILINNAAIIQPMGPTVTVDPEEWMQTMNITLGGAFRWMHVCLPGMLERGWGRIVSLSSASGIGTGMQHGNAYSVAKAGVEMFVRNLAQELAGSGVTVNAVRPGWVDTGMQTYVRELSSEQAGDALSTYVHTIHARGELLRPEQPARLVVNLLQEEKTGEVISIYDQRSQHLS